MPKNRHKSTYERSPLIVPKEYEVFAQSFFNKFAAGEFLGETSPTKNRALFTCTLGLAKQIYEQTLVDTEKTNIDQFEPSTVAKNRTLKATQIFFKLAVQYMKQGTVNFPLSGLNKCLGVVAVPHSKLALIAISQGKDPSQDVELRKNMVQFLNQLNQLSSFWQFELVCIPTTTQYLMPRAFFMRTPHQAPDFWVTPPTRCVEVALMTGLCKVGRFSKFKFDPHDVAIMAFGGTIWTSPKGTQSYRLFKQMDRNRKYTHEVLEVPLLGEESGWVDVWDPCPQHCARYRRQMIAIAAAGGFSTSFDEPRGEWCFEDEKETSDLALELNQHNPRREK